MVKSFVKKVKELFSSFGPGFITGASDDDPSGIGTYSQTGAMFGYNQLWTAVFSFPFMTAVQEMCGRIGLVTGKGLAGVIRQNYSKKILYFSVFVLLIANTVNIGADLGAMAAAGALLVPIPYAVLLIGMTIVSLLLQVFVSYHLYSKVLKYLTFSLLAYIIAAFVVKQDWTMAIRSTLIPSFSFSHEYLMNIVAILGTTISPYLFFWQASEEVEEEVEEKKLKIMGHGIPKFGIKDLKRLRIDTMIGMFFSNLVMFFIILTAASTLGAQGIRNIQTAADAAAALQPLAGDFAYLLFASGVIGTGLLAVPVLAGSASYALSEAFGWKEGLYRKFTQAHGFYGVITLATLFGLLINFTSIPPFKLLYYTSILNGICAPPLLILILLISNNKKILGEHTNSKFSNIAGVTITVLMFACVGALLVSSL